MIPITKPYFNNDERKAVAQTIASGWVLQGPRVEAFEEKLKEYIGTSYAIATSSATTALHMALMILGIGPGDEVLVPSFSYIASANCIVHAGATPVFVDIDPQTYNLDPSDIEKKISNKTKGIMVVHQIGLPADMPALLKIAKTHHLKIIEDAACGLGSKIKSQHVGTFGNIGCFSFHPRKIITTAEGGLLVTENKDWAKTAQMMRAHGADTSAYKRHDSKTFHKESFPIIGYNYRMSDVHAAIGLAQYKKLRKILSSRKEQAARYNRAFQNNPNLQLPHVPEGFTHTFQSYLLRIVDGEKIRNKLVTKLLEKGITTKYGISPSHLEPPYRTMYPSLTLPITEKAALETIILPTYVQLSRRQQDHVIQSFLDELTKLLP